MRTDRLLWLAILLPCLAAAQTFQKEMASIPVTRAGRELQIPWNGGLHSLSVAMPDIDDDGDADLLLTGRDEGRLQFYRNDGNGAAGEFTFVTAALSDIDLGIYDNRLAFGDLDADGDSDLLVGHVDGRLSLYQNTGAPNNPAFSLLTAFFDSIDVGYQAAPAFGDLDQDGRADLLVGSYREGILYYHREAAGPRAFTFVDTLRDINGQIVKPGFQFYAPALADIDADGDLDLFAGSSDPALALYRNIGSAAALQFVSENLGFVTPPENMSFITPAFVDIDNDLDLDLFCGSNHGFVTFYRNDGTPSAPSFNLTIQQLVLDFLDFGFYAVPALVDIDGDADLDLFCGSESGGLDYLENTGDSVHPQFQWQTDPFQEVFVGRDLAIAWDDLDSDGDFDLLVGTSIETVYLFSNNGTSVAAQLDSIGALQDTSSNPVRGFRPELADIDADRDLDLFLVVWLPDGRNAIRVYENIGTPQEPAFTLWPEVLTDQNGAPITSYDMLVRLADIDHDDDLDLFLGTADGNIVSYENTGSPAMASFALVTVLFGNVETGGSQRCFPFFADIDADNDLDLFVGRNTGGLFFYRNTTVPTTVHGEGVTSLQSFALAQNYPNPFNPVTTIRFALAQRSRATLKLHDILGREVMTLVDKELPSGEHRAVLDATNLASGVYLCRLQAEALSETRKIVVLK